MSKRRAPPPPREGNGRFVKGCSGNPGGRPRASANKAPNASIKIPIRVNGKRQLADPKPLIMKRLANSALIDKSLEAARLFMREDRLGARQAAKAAPAPAAGSRPKGKLLYHEEALLFMGVLKRNRWGQLVVPRSVFADLDRLYSKGTYSARAWRVWQLAVEAPGALRNRFPGKRLTYTTEMEANRARAEVLDEAFAEVDAMAAELKELRSPKKRRRL